MVDKQTHRLALALFSCFLAMGGLLATPAQSYDGELFVVCGLNPYGDNFLSLRTCGSTRCTEIMRLGPDTPLRTWEPYGERGWRQVDVLPYLDAPHSGRYPAGWVFERYICPVRY
ncbi:hypothetical protein SAMN04488056_102372 [Cohaesibacter marisflavi]|uniref:SH3 domain-containing protein n=1 Tax=Cohaesibacter marisflavi TaxID=655353 RepID=A0A1I5CWM3_9HYPH|nr:hypothetical protein [Cohaesibacter marisflavi]SFN91031.1 hypothetical protein SAMN04488056_102372 [Cohaesibacter marisflavi]